MCMLVIKSTHLFCLISKTITVEFLQYQLRRVHIIPVTKVSCILVGIYMGDVCFAGKN